jgi:hypothetical protein
MLVLLNSPRPFKNLSKVNTSEPAKEKGAAESATPTETFVPSAPESTAAATPAYRPRLTTDRQGFPYSLEDKKREKLADKAFIIGGSVLAGVGAALLGGVVLATLGDLTGTASLTSEVVSSSAMLGQTLAGGAVGLVSGLNQANDNSPERSLALSAGHGFSAGVLVALGQTMPVVAAVTGTLFGAAAAGGHFWMAGRD